MAIRYCPKPYSETYQSCICQHQFDSILLVYLGSAGVIVDRYNISLWVLLLDDAHNALSANMVWQTSEWLSADNIVDVIMLNQLNHLCGQKPSFAHFNAFSNISFGGFDCAFKMTWRLEIAVLLNQMNHVALSAAQEMVYLAHHCRFDCVDAIQIMVKLNVMCTVKQKVKQSRTNNFASFREQKFLQLLFPRANNT